MASVDAARDRCDDRHVSAHFGAQPVPGPDSVVESVKIATDHVKESSSPLASSRGASLSTSPDQGSDAASVHSMPAVLVSEPPPLAARRPSTSASHAPAPAPPSRPLSTLPQRSQPDSPTPLSHQQRRARHRSAIEVRSSSRLSGFFNNLIHRREGALPSPARETIAEDQDASKPTAEKASRPVSPAPTVLPPPSLPPPTLQELGLSLSVVTSDLCPTHFSTPPASGAFLAPHYLLLCHAQGLDVLPLTSPPAPQPYALVRRVAFKSVVVMEHRGVLVAIAGRRDGVRVYALEEVKKAIEWRIDVEIRRERERLRREASKRVTSRSENEARESGEKPLKASLSTPPPTDNLKSILRKASHGNMPYPPPSSPPPLVPRAPRTPTRSRRKSRIASLQIPQPSSEPTELPSSQPPPYASPTDAQPTPVLRSQPSALSVRARARSNSVSHVLAGVSTLARNDEASGSLEHRAKSDDWAGSSDDEAIDIRAAASGSQALDERTSATLSANRSPSSTAVASSPPNQPHSSTNSSRRRRPSNLDLSATRNANVANPEPSPAPTLLTLRQALQHLPPEIDTPDLFDDLDEEEDETDGRISLAQALMESRIPDLPPLGTTQPQEPILLSTTQNTFQETGNTSKWLSAPPPPPPAPPPKLEYVKLPGTKGALMIKAVETQKKLADVPSFLAILCGENGEKVELFAGTYRTALGLSRTFILPDSPRSLELQLQGDDLVEVFLVFAQNVFGLEPATVRVREVRIGRAERRAARRRARENRLGSGEPSAADNEVNEEDNNASVSLGVSMTVAPGDDSTRPSTPPLVASEHPDAPDESRAENNEPTPVTPTLPIDELAVVVSAQMGPYTTFQQLSFAPQFPLAAIADEYIIPPTYPNFLSYRDEHEHGEDLRQNNGSELAPTQFSPPGLPRPAPSGPTQWYYKDPKGVMHGPWPSNLMQAWYRDGLLPSDLPVRREGELEYTLLRDLKMQCVDPAHPFRSPPPPTHQVNTFHTPLEKEKPLLPPISLLAQPKHFGPPPLFFSSRGGHSTAIVDTRGRSVLKGRFIWSNDEVQDESKTSAGKMGDVKHLEALDVKDHSVLIAMRQGGLEAVDLSDALLRPADQSRTTLPSFHPPSNVINRRPPFIWKIGTPIESSGGPLSALSSKGKSTMPKKAGIGITKSATSTSQGSVGLDPDCDPNDEVLFLGRKKDEIYYCERNVGSFRILRLCPDTNHE
ncbi:hypothetical protein AN958_04887 [Leucoagaricus sp. SymC.cos]|nr:hypothetical protein AN958_04887 [Leucoagaricus sp. SymC.cos]